MLRRVGGHRPRVRHRRLQHQVRPALLGLRRSRSSTSWRRTGAASTARSCSGSRCSRSFGSVAVLRESRAAIGCSMPWVVAMIAVVEMFFLFLMVVHNNPFETFLTTHAAAGAGPEPAAAELLHGDPSADALPRLRRHDDSVRVRHRGARHRAARRLVAARRAPLDDDGVAVPDGRPVAWRAVGVRRARLGRLLGLGSGRERRRCCRGSRRRRSCTR